LSSLTTPKRLDAAKETEGNYLCREEATLCIIFALTHRTTETARNLQIKTYEIKMYNKTYSVSKGKAVPQHAYGGTGGEEA
jgi:hypothetical protein